MYENLLPKVKTSKDTEETFDPINIENSLVKETCLNQKQAHEVAMELTRRVISYKIKVLTSPEIRELVCSILLEKSFDESRFKYTRLGLPFYDFDKLGSDFFNKEYDKSKKFSTLEKKIDQEIIKERIYNQMAYEYREIKKILGQFR